MKILKMPTSKQSFLDSAQPFTLVAKFADGTEVDLGRAEPREFSSTSIGWGINAKGRLPFGEFDAPVQVGCNFTVVHSKDLPASEPAPLVSIPKTASPMPVETAKPRRKVA